MELSKVRGEKGMTLLHNVVLENRLDVITVIFDAGLLIDSLPLAVTGEQSNYYNMTAMDIARRLRYIPVQDEIERCKEVEHSMNWLHRMCREGNKKNVQEILQKHPDLLEQEACDHTSPIFWAVTSGQLEVVKVLVDKGELFVLSILE